MPAINAIENYENDIGINHSFVCPALSLEIRPLYVLFISRGNNSAKALDKGNMLVS